MILKINEKLQKEIDKYFNLNIGGKKVVCPYYINTKLSAGNLRVMAGKGSTQEIELETSVWAKVRNYDLVQASSEEIRRFMIKEHIGIDCSGFMAQILDTYLRESNKGSLVSKLKFNSSGVLPRLRRYLRPIENIGANTLTSDLNCTHINDLNEIRPGDLIRAKGKQKNAHHVGMIVEVEISQESSLSKVEVKSFKYVNSHRYYGDENGVRYGEVIVTNPDGELKDQDWKDVHSDGVNFFLEDLLVDYDDNGVRRFKNIKI